MKHTKKWAKKLSLEIWTYLRDHPEITRKNELPKKLWNKIKNLYCFCPLCNIASYCVLCPLNDCSDYKLWYHAKTNKTRAKYAGMIVDKIDAWKV